MVPGTELRLRIRVVAPPPNVSFQVQRGKDGLEPPARHTSSSVEFEFAVRVGKQPDGSPNFLGPFAQGPPRGRFVYVNSGTLAGDAGSCWTRRAKVPLTGISWALVAKATSSGGIVESHIDGLARDRGPACGTVKLRQEWRVVERAQEAEDMDV